VSGGPSVPSYDQAGNILSDNNGDGNSYLYDAEGRICAAQTPAVDGINIWTGYVYDAEGRRVAKGTITSWSCDSSTNGFGASANETDYVLDQSGHQVTEMASDANGTMAWAHTNVWAGGQLIATYSAITDANGQADGALHFYFNDWLGTRRIQTDYAGVVEQTCASLPYGDQKSCAPMPTENLFTGKERDSESGNDYFGARYYASTMGRFLSPDWSKNPQGAPYADYMDPQTLNLYEYVRNNPLGGVDPDGHDPAAEFEGAQRNMDAFFASAWMTGNSQQQQQQAQQQNAGASPSSGGTSTTVTLNIGGKKVTVAYSYGKIFSNYGGGVDITATPQNCSGCAWAQVYSRGSGAKKDGDGIGPLYGDEGRGLSVFYDTPASSSPGRFTATTILGTTDISGKSFTAIGGFTYGYSINANGGVTMMAPSVATRSQMSGAIQVLQNNSPDWTIH
jgi:RHS repeat-associated protein